MRERIFIEHQIEKSQGISPDSAFPLVVQQFAKNSLEELAGERKERDPRVNYKKLEPFLQGLAGMPFEGDQEGSFFKEPSLPRDEYLHKVYTQKVIPFLIGRKIRGALRSNSHQKPYDQEEPSNKQKLMVGVVGLENLSNIISYGPDDDRNIQEIRKVVAERYSPSVQRLIYSLLDQINKGEVNPQALYSNLYQTIKAVNKIVDTREKIVREGGRGIAHFAVEESLPLAPSKFKVALGFTALASYLTACSTPLPPAIIEQAPEEIPALTPIPDFGEETPQIPTEVIIETPKITQTPTLEPTPTPEPVVCEIDPVGELFTKGLETGRTTVPVLSEAGFKETFGLEGEKAKKMKSQISSQIAYELVKLLAVGPVDRVVIPEYLDLDLLKQGIEGYLALFGKDSSIIPEITNWSSAIPTNQEGAILLSVHAGKEGWTVGAWKKAKIEKDPVDNTNKLSGIFVNTFIRNNQTLVYEELDGRQGNISFAIVNGCLPLVVGLDKWGNVIETYDPRTGEDQEITPKQLDAQIRNSLKREISQNFSIPSEINEVPGTREEIREEVYGVLVNVDILLDESMREITPVQKEYGKKPINDIKLNKKIPDASQRIAQGTAWAIYRAWKENDPQARENVTFEQYMNMVKGYLQKQKDIYIQDVGVYIWANDMATEGYDPAPRFFPPEKLFGKDSLITVVCKDSDSTGDIVVYTSISAFGTQFNGGWVVIMFDYPTEMRRVGSYVGGYIPRNSQIFTSRFLITLLRLSWQRWEYHRDVNPWLPESFYKIKIKEHFPELFDLLYDGLDSGGWRRGVLVPVPSDN